jgi:lipid-A-disaccharide synthase
MNKQMSVRFEIARASNIDRDFLQAAVEQWQAESGPRGNMHVSSETSAEVLRRSDAALVKSGTSTLEALVLGIPFAMVYRVSLLSWLVLRPFVAGHTFCLANLVAGRQIVPEFVQWKARGTEIGRRLMDITSDPGEWRAMREALLEARQRLGSKNAYVEGARQIDEAFLQ